MTSPKPCRGCIFAGYSSFGLICQYILVTHQRRPCPYPRSPGDTCTARRTIALPREEKNHMRQPDWDTVRARQLLEEGQSDLQVAEAVGASLTALRSWKQRNGLIRPRAPKRQKDQDSGVATQDAAPEEESQDELEAPPATQKLDKKKKKKKKKHGARGAGAVPAVLGRVRDLHQRPGHRQCPAGAGTAAGDRR